MKSVILIKKKKIMRGAGIIYKVHDQYLMNRERLFTIIKKELDEFFIVHLPEDVRENKDYPISKEMTDISNEFSIGNVTLPMDVLIIDQEYRDVQTNAQVLIKLNLTVREEIEGETYG